MIRQSAACLIALAVAAAAAGCPAAATAQIRTVTPSVDEALRPLYANAGDVAEGKRLADTTCSACHGAAGISAMADVPNLAGERPAYLYTELRAYKTGVRGNTTMASAVKFLSDDALIKVAAYYASLDPAQPSAANGPVAAPATDPVQAGKAAAVACAGCHGSEGVSKTPGTPSLAGQDPKYLIAAMKEYKSGQRKNDVMKSTLAATPEAQWSNIALYFALQKPARAATPVAGNASAGRDAAAACAGCHGDKGVSANPAIPSLAGQDAQYFAAALHEYKSGIRGDETMKGLAASLDDAAIKNVAAYYASLPPQQPSVRRPMSAAEWAQRCDRCHGVNGNSTDPGLPALAAQRADYLAKVLQAYRTGARRSPQMAAMSEGLTPTDIDNLAAYYSRQKARSFVYVMPPPK